MPLSAPDSGDRPKGLVARTPEKGASVAPSPDRLAGAGTGGTEPKTRFDPTGASEADG
ncbi:hypothetical protein [Myxococcus xanthus]|uniref:hypothetical protein n=1 Tax=Myxococcus xanthus TaxID=34 RepID=UPI0013968100|nr:hypothetical protein [Myxococcus xanthus]